jgi:hypothetical protein
MKSIIAQYRDQIQEATTRAEVNDIQDCLHDDYENGYIEDEDMECLLERAVDAYDEIFLNSNPFNQ